MGLAAALLGPVVISVALPLAYADAVPIVAWVAVGFVFYGWYTIPMNALSIIRGDTKWAWTATALAASVNVGANIVLVPRIGIMAAAVNTALGYGVLLVAAWLLARRANAMTIPLERGRILGGISLLVALYLVTASVSSPDEPAGIAVRIVTTIVAAAALVVMGAWSQTATQLRRLVGS